MKPTATSSATDWPVMMGSLRAKLTDERLAELAQLSPEELLRELEKELLNNKPMQEEVSDIAEDVLADAQETLEQAEEEEDEGEAAKEAPTHPPWRPATTRRRSSACGSSSRAPSS